MNASRENSFERRIEPRYSYAGNIFFATTRRFYEGRLTNFSAHGLFIKTRENLSIGQSLTIAIPFLDDDNDKRHGRIVWQNKNGFGVALLEAMPAKKKNQSMQSKEQLRKNAA
jgi:hypothetical protein